MLLKIHKDYEALSQHAAREIIRTVSQKPQAVLCLATGDTPRRTYALVAQMMAAEKIAFTQCTFIGLDEWVGIPPENGGSCHFFLQQSVFEPWGIRPAQIHLFNGMATDLVRECETMSETIGELGGIDVMLVGIGMNGHVGFNEPAASLEPYAHVVELDRVTTTVGQKYFTGDTALKKGITLGMEQVMQARHLILVANGAKKARVIRQALEGAVTPRVPASLIRNHPNSWVILDESAASALAGTR